MLSPKQYTRPSETLRDGHGLSRLMSIQECLARNESEGMRAVDLSCKLSFHG